MGSRTPPPRELATPTHRRSDLSAAELKYAKELLGKKTSALVDCGARGEERVAASAPH